jgi:hypothetical protein
MDRVLERISTWEAAGLIDPATAARLRLAEADRSLEASTPEASIPPIPSESRTAREPSPVDSPPRER